MFRGSRNLNSPIKDDISDLIVIKQKHFRSLECLYFCSQLQDAPIPIGFLTNVYSLTDINFLNKWLDNLSEPMGYLSFSPVKKEFVRAYFKLLREQNPQLSEAYKGIVNQMIDVMIEDLRQPQRCEYYLIHAKHLTTLSTHRVHELSTMIDLHNHEYDRQIDGIVETMQQQIPVTKEKPDLEQDVEKVKADLDSYKPQINEDETQKEINAIVKKDQKLQKRRNSGVGISDIASMALFGASILGGFYALRKNGTSPFVNAASKLLPFKK